MDPDASSFHTHPHTIYLVSQGVENNFRWYVALMYLPGPGIAWALECLIVVYKYSYQTIRTGRMRPHADFATLDFPAIFVVSYQT